MEILGIGPMELVLILLIAMMVFGPDKLPEIGAKLGQSMKAMRKATREFSQEIEGARQVVQAPMQELTQPFQELAKPVQDLGKDIAPLAKAVTNPQEALRQAVTGELTQPAARSDAPASVPDAAAGSGATQGETTPPVATTVTIDAAAPVDSTITVTGASKISPTTQASETDSPAQATPVRHAIARHKLDRTRRQRWQSAALDADVPSAPTSGYPVEPAATSDASTPATPGVAHGEASPEQYPSPAGEE
jgi:TatA/E family protein of Tat protein translocase